MKHLSVVVGALVCAAGDAAAQERIRIVSIGDSLASGEGNPDNPNGSGVSGRMWDGSRTAADRGWGEPAPLAAIDNQDDRCHRSQRSGHKLSSLLFGAGRPGDVVEFTSVACSGATIPHLVSDGQFESIDGVIPQLDRVAQLFPPDDPDGAIDVLLVSIGINDVGFGGAVSLCIGHPNCPDAAQFSGGGDPDPWPADPSPDDALTGRPEARRDRLMDRWAILIREIEARLPNVGLVIVHEYPDGMTDFWGQPCNGDTSAPGWFARRVFPLLDPMGGISAAESTWASEKGIGYLNTAIRTKVGDAAARSPSRWSYHQGLASRFVRHGFCAGSDAAWIRLFTESMNLQGNENGTAHPNPAGHTVYAEVLRDRLNAVDWTAARAVIASPVSGVAVESGASSPRVSWSYLGPAMFFQVAVRNAAGMPVAPPPDGAGVPWDLEGAADRSPGGDATIWFDAVSGWRTSTRIGTGATRDVRVPLPAQGLWQVAVRACSFRTCGPWSLPVVSTYGPPATPTGLHQKPAAAGYVWFDWTHTGPVPAVWSQLAWRWPGGAWYYRNFYPQGQPFTVVTTPTAIDAFVRACNSSGCSPWSAGVRGATAPPVTGPSNLHRYVPPYTIPDGVDLRWTNPSPPRGGWIQLAVATQTATILPNGVGIVAPYAQYVLAESAVGHHVQVELASWVRACNAAGCTPWSARPGNAALPTPSTMMPFFKPGPGAAPP